MTVLAFRERVVADFLWSNFADVRAVVLETYLTLDQAINPYSSFLRFDRDDYTKRIIALPAASGSAVGIKWVASVPSNHNHDVPRASAVLVLNDFETGRPHTFMSASELSLVRTAVSAILLAEKVLGSERIRAPLAIGIIGAGELARRVLKAGICSGWNIERLSVLDSDSHRAAVLADDAEA